MQLEIVKTAGFAIAMRVLKYSEKKHLSTFNIGHFRMNWFFQKLQNFKKIGRSRDGANPAKLGLDHFPPTLSGQTVYAIGDIHGRLDLLTTIHAKIDEDWTKSPSERGKIEIYMGDMIDRGDDSAGVLECLIVRAEECDCVFLSGNHELEFLKILDGSPTPPQIWNWMKFGGAATALSYSVTNLPHAIDESAFTFIQQLRANMPQSHLALLRTSKLYHIVEPYVFVHAGIRPSASMAEQDVEDLVGIRDEFLDSRIKHQYIVVHGHSPVNQVELLENRINVDTGAYATGVLSSVRIGSNGGRILTS